MPQARWDLESERLLWADLCSQSFWWFLKISFGAEFYMRANPNDKWLTKRVHKPVCDWLEDRVRLWEARRAKGVKKRTKIALVLPRSFGKTVMATKALTMWAQLRNPDIASYIGSEVRDKAIAFLDPIKTIYEGKDPYAWYPWLYGTWYSPERTWGAKFFVHAARKTISRSEPSYSSWGVETGITGAHPDWGVFDDPISEEKIRESGNWIETVNTSMAALRPALRTDSFFLLALTRYRDSDIVGTFVTNEKGEGVKTWNGMKPKDDIKITAKGEWEVYFLQAFDKDGETILPEVWPTEELRTYEETRPVEFAAQMMNEPGTGEHMPLDSEQISQMWIDREFVPQGLRLTIHLDTAFKKQKNVGEGDESVIQVWGHDPRGNGEVYYLEGHGSDRWRIEQFTEELVAICQRLRKQGRRIKCITDEREIGGKAGSWENYLKGAFHDKGMAMPPLVTLGRAGLRKSVRIREAAGFWADGLVHLVKGAPGIDNLVRQMLRIGVSPHDDWADAAADVFAQEVYRPMLNPALENGKEEGGFPVQPGDDILGRHFNSLTNDTVRSIYDSQNEELVEKIFGGMPE